MDLQTLVIGMLENPNSGSDYSINYSILAPSVCSIKVVD